MLSFSPVVGIGTRRRVWGRGTLAGERGGGRVPIPTRDIHCGTLYICTLCTDIKAPWAPAAIPGLLYVKSE